MGLAKGKQRNWSMRKLWDIPVVFSIDKKGRMLYVVSDSPTKLREWARRNRYLFPYGYNLNHRVWGKSTLENTRKIEV